MMTVSLVLSLAMAVCVHADESAEVSLDETGTTKVTMTIGDSMTLVLKSGEEVVSPSEVKFKSSKTKVAKVTKKGVIKAKKKGSAVITAQYNGLSKKIKVSVKKVKQDSGLTSSNGAGKMTCSSGKNIKTGKIITMKLNKTAASHNWTWSFSSEAAADARILNGDYKNSRKITFTVWPGGGFLTLIGTDPEGYRISYDFKVKQTKTWARREKFRDEALAGISASMTKADMVKYFADFIADRASYASTSYFAILDGNNGDCISYSVAFKFLADAVGIETIIVKNGGSRSHYWNQVKIDDVWYNVDAQGYDTSRSKKWVLSSDDRHGWYASTTFYSQSGINYPFSPANICTRNYK